MSTSTITRIASATRADANNSPSVTRRTALRSISGGLTAAVAIAAAPRLVKAGPEHAHPNPVESVMPEGVLGAWDLSFRRLDAAVEGKPERALITFAPDGGFQAALAPISVTADRRVRFNSGGLGGWSAWDHNTVAARYTVLIYDEIGQFAGIRTVSVTVQPDQGKGTLTGTYYSQLYDLEGELAEFVSGSLTAVPARARGIAQTPAWSPENGPVPISSDLDNLPPQPGRPGKPY